MPANFTPDLIVKLDETRCLVVPPGESYVDVAGRVVEWSAGCFVTHQGYRRCQSLAEVEAQWVGNPDWKPERIHPWPWPTQSD